MRAMLGVFSRARRPGPNTKNAPMKHLTNHIFEYFPGHFVGRNFLRSRQAPGRTSKV